MRAKRYLARTLPEAKAQIKADLGDQAVILHTQPVVKGGIWGLFGRRMFEVLAAVDGDVATSVGPRQRPTAVPMLPYPASARAAAAHQLAPAQPSLVTRPPTPIPPVNLAAAYAAPVLVGGETNPAAELADVHQRLVIRGVDPRLAGDLLRRLRDGTPEAACGLFRPADLVRAGAQSNLGPAAAITPYPGQQRVVALVGPTGVGKTTTLAKLAASFALGQQLRVAVFTADTYRIAAVEQLRTYCQIMRVPLEVVVSPDEVAAARSRHAAADLILVDTAGRSHRSPHHMAELRQYLDSLRADEVHLVLSLTASARDALAAAAAYADLGFHRLLFTKLDEAAAPAMFYNVMAEHRKPASYLTTGQTVPDDIEVARPERLAALLVGDERS